MAKRHKKTKTELPGSKVKLSPRRHLLPPLAGVLVIALIFGFFSANLISGRAAHYLYSRRSNRLTDLQANRIPVSYSGQLIIGKIGLQTPVNFSEKTVDKTVLLDDMRDGTVRYPQTALPGQEGNVVIFGHSSSPWWSPGRYKFVFSVLDKMNNGDFILLDYHNARYIYKVYNVKIVDSDNYAVLNQGSSHILSLITSSPAGSDYKRLVVSASQVYPKVLVDTGFDKAAFQPPKLAGGLPGDSNPFWYSFKRVF